jgi:hypothetical protein
MIGPGAIASPWPRPNLERGPMKTDPTLTIERLREVLDYDPLTGIFRWKIRPACCIQVGDVAGGDNGNGRCRIRVDRRRFYTHHLAWAYMYGVWPKFDLDHRNGNPSDNRIANLREDPDGQNAQNRADAVSKRPTASGWMGVRPNFNRWQASIRVNGRSRHLGLFDTPEEAHAAYLVAKEKLHPFWRDR